MTCEEAEIAIGMRQHGALAAEETAVLEAHLDGCAGCRAFAAMSKTTEQTMQAKMIEEVGAIDWDRITTGLEKIRSSDRARIPRALFVSAILIAAFSATKGEQWFLFATKMTLASVATITFVWWRNHQRASAAVVSQDSPLELLVLYRRQIGDDLRRYFAAQLVAPVLGIYCAISEVRAWRESGFTIDSLPWVGMVAALFAVGGVSAYRYRRLKAEKRELA